VLRRGSEHQVLDRPFVCALMLMLVNFAHQAYIRVQLGINAVNDARHNHAADHFSAAVKSSGLSSISAIDHVCEDFVVVR
jgi:hypothetical protein